MRRLFKIALLGLVLTTLQGPLNLVQATEVGYDKGFYLMSEDKAYKFKFNLQIQPRYEYQRRPTTFDVNTFKMARLRTVFQGNAFSPKYKYLLTIDYSDAAGKVNLRDGLVQLDLASFFSLTLGQFQTPINREDIWSGYAGQTVNLSLLFSHFEVGRDLGAQISGQIVSPLKYYLFLSNGDGRNINNKNGELFLGTRFEYSILGKMSPFQGDPDHSEKPNLGIASTIAYDFGSAAETADFTQFVNQGLTPNENKLLRGDVDANFTWLGYSLFGQWQFVRNSQYRNWDQGISFQSGYFIIPKRLEIAGRYSVVYPAFPIPALAITGITSPKEPIKGSDLGGIPIYEYVGGVNYFFKSHYMKVQADYTQIRNRGGFRNLNDQIIRAQLTLVF